MNYIVLVFRDPSCEQQMESAVGPFKSAEIATNWVVLHGVDEKFYRVVKLEVP